jgi:hypothetical protein
LVELAPGCMTAPVGPAVEDEDDDVVEVVDVVIRDEVEVVLLRDVVVVVLLRDVVEVLERVVLVVLVLVELEVEKVLIGPEQILGNCCEVGSCGIQPPARPF